MRITSYRESKNKIVSLNLKAESLSQVADADGRYDVRIYLEPSFGNEYISLSEINLVEYQLPIGFKRPVNVSKDPSRGFEIMDNIPSGVYTVMCTVYLKHGGIEYIQSAISI